MEVKFMRKIFTIFSIFLVMFNLSLGSILEEIEKERIKIVEDVAPGVATIFTVREVKIPNPFAYSPFSEFFGIPNQKEFKQRQEGLGSGFIVKIDKKKKLVYLLTNNHVVENATNIKVQFKNKITLDAKIIGTDKLADVAVIAVPFKNGIEKYAEKHILKFGNSDELKPGMTVIAIGSPLGLKWTVTEGIISALDRAIEGHPGEGFIQTDAAINPGNSGGPLVNIKGEVIGINTAIIAGAQGLGFAVPINQAKWIMEQILKYGKVKRGRLGVVVQPLTPELGKYFNLNYGVIITQVLKNSPAEKSGLKAGDIIIAVNGKKVEDPNDLQKYIMRTMPGKKVVITVVRDKEKKEIEVVVGSWEDDIDVGNLQELEIRYGLIVKDITPQILEKYKLPKVPYGVVVYGVKFGSPADEAGLRSGDIIMSVNRHPVRSAEEFWKFIKKAEKKGKEDVLLKIRRGATVIFTVMPIIKDDK
jgi:serine protease Do